MQVKYGAKGAARVSVRRYVCMRIFAYVKGCIDILPCLKWCLSALRVHELSALECLLVIAQ